MVIVCKLKLYPSKKLTTLLQKYQQKFFDCLQDWIQGIRQEKSTNLKRLHSKYYFGLRRKYGLSSRGVQLAGMEAIHMVRKTRKSREKAPFFKKKFIVTGNLRIKKQRIRFMFGDRKEYWCKFRGQMIPEGELRESKIKFTNGNWYCFLAIKINEPRVKQYKRYLGVDLGIARIAVMCDSKGRNCKFFSGEQVRFKRSHYYRLRKKSQPDIKRANVYKFLKRISKKESNWMTDTNHKVSRKIVYEAIEQRKGIALENLSGITQRLRFNKRTRRMVSSWPFRQLRTFIEYKAKRVGIPVILVDPRGTSKTCPKCLHATRSNRPKQALFRCVKCGYQSNADRVGAMNISRIAEDTVRLA